MRMVDPALHASASDLLECAADALRVAGELHRRGIGEEFALPRNGTLNQASKEDPDITDRHHGGRQGYDCKQRTAAFAVPASAATPEACMGAAAQNALANDRDHEDAEEHAHEAYVHAHVAIEDVAELVGDYALQLVARQ